MQDKFYIAGILRETGRLVTVAGENPFKARAYERAARAVEAFAGDFDALIKSHRLTQIDGVGNALAGAIEEIYRTGESASLQRLRDELPPGVVELSQVAGLSVKKIAALHDALGIQSIADLKTACEKGSVKEVKGFGVKAETNLLAAIEKLQRRESRMLLSHALDEAERLLEYLRLAPAVMECDAAGSLRRRKETVKRITLVAASDNIGAVSEHFLRYPGFTGSDAIDVRRSLGRLPEGLEVELDVVRPGDYITALHRRTGSTAHLGALQRLAGAKGIALDADGLRGPGGRRLKVITEQDIYRRLGLEYIAPELREHQGEIEAAAEKELPEVATPQDIQGMIHCHTRYSDGRNSIEEMALAASAMGMKYLTVTDHSPSAFYAGGVKIDRLRAQWDEIDRVQERVQIRLLKGTESDILEDGSLDYPDYILERFDIIIASIHSRHKMDAGRMTARLLRAVKLPLFKIWGHPLGRLIPSRPPLECHMEEVLDAVADARAAIEVNGSPHRLDLEPSWIRAARRRGIKFVVSTDAHSVRELHNLSFGTAMARRGWLSRKDILNTLPVTDFMKAVRP